ncbi:MAG: cbb3-type cytochrome c oxidase subunit I [Xanthomonadales bacterium]|uniref:cbb3-type cytochrome c oxidase subunit I n=1 Tax=Dokdonella sp. TaxID=2291710 RepID=UPI002C788830|nr:cbb3-type cytochrome c oxidase subunit I [Xanthomonadales bacterium]MBK7210608.1 cbb3-type cytochrome c oxidase subunit I [Xanthomonadales bacterium]HQW77117.1 cbb3-type cytochrome c oxidase subunit I [Dokdonella sp.]HQZ61290.1 cbb3-type cytochrome c oxidase subunit I [Dokdonella sp.]
MSGEAAATREPSHAGAAIVPTSRYTLSLVRQSDRSLVRGWLWLGLLALVVSGFYSILLVASRTPGVNAWLPVADFFRVALVVHVDLSVLVWFLALSGMLWSLSCRPRATPLAWLAMLLAYAGTLLIGIAPFVGGGEPIMANYIPVLDGSVFLAGLGILGVAAALLVLRSLIAAPALGLELDGSGALRFGLNASVVATAIALIAFAASLWLTPASLEGKAYYEIAFWGGGHALQFTWTLLMLVAWLWLASAVGARLPLSPRIALLLLALALVSVFMTPYAYLAHDVATVEHRDLHTWAMRLGGGVAIVPIGLAVVVGLLRSPRSREAGHDALRAALVASMLLFAAGGVIGMFISGSNVKIPAHYHGCIVGVTLALMGLVYLLLPKLGYQTPQGRLAHWQPVLYGGGQLMHIIGLVWSGGYGVQRKVAGAEQVLHSKAEIAGMGLMGLGGLIAIIGGLMFVVVVWNSLRGNAGKAARSLS